MLSVGGIFLCSSFKKKYRQTVTATCGQRKKEEKKIKVTLHEIFITHPLLFNGSVVTLSDSRMHVLEKLKLMYTWALFFFESSENFSRNKEQYHNYLNWFLSQRLCTISWIFFNYQETEKFSLKPDRWLKFYGNYKIILCEFHWLILM